MFCVLDDSRKATEHLTFRWKPLLPESPEVARKYSSFVRVSGRSCLIYLSRPVGAHPHRPGTKQPSGFCLRSIMQLLSTTSRSPVFTRGSATRYTLLLNPPKMMMSKKKRRKGLFRLAHHRITTHPRTHDSLNTSRAQRCTKNKVFP